MPTDTSLQTKKTQQKEENWRAQVLDGLLRSLFAFGLITLVAAIINVLKDEHTPDNYKIGISLVYLLSFALLASITFIKRISYFWKSITLLLILYVLAVTGLIGAGLSGDGRAFIMAFVVATAILFDLKRSLIALVIGVGTLIAAAVLFIKGVIYVSPEFLANSTNGSAWTTGIIVLVLLSVLLMTPIVYLIKTLEEKNQYSQELLEEVARQHDTLEKLVEARTQELEHRAKQLELSSQVARDTLVFTDVNELLIHFTQLIAEEFGYYHVGIFLLDKHREYAILQAASSAEGEKMLKKGYQLQIGDRSGVVGRVASEKHPVIIQGEENASVFFNNPNLPDTRSEMAIPISAQNELLGVLDIQSSKSQAFNQQDVEIFQTLASQLALAVQNKRLFAETQSTIAQLRTLTAQQTQAAWSAYLKNRSHRFRYTPLGVKPLQTKPSFTTEENENILRVPIILQGKSIGSIALKRPAQAWTEKEKTLIADISAQVGLAIENARLVEETRKQAQEEQLVSKFSTKLRETLDMDTVVKTAVDEMKKTFALKEVEIRLNTLDNE